MSRIKTQAEKVKRTRTLREAFVNDQAAIDLASIMVGIIVIGIIGGVIAATVFAVIPWAQDNAAKESLRAVKTAQDAHYGINDYYSSNLKTLLKDSDNRLSVFASGSCYSAFTKSSTGKTFYFTSQDGTVRDYTTLPTRPTNFPNECTWPINANDSVGQSIVPDLSEWTTTGATTFDKKTGAIKFNQDNDKIASPLIKIGKNKQYSVQVDGLLPAINSTEKAVIIGVTYYAEDGKTLVKNPTGFSSNGSTSIIPADKANQWTRVGFNALGQAGSGAEFPAEATYLQVQFRSSTLYSPASYQIKSPSVVITNR